MESKGRVFWQLTRGFRGRYAAAIVALGVGTFAGYLGPLVTRWTVDAIVATVSAAPNEAPDWFLRLIGDSLATRLWMPAAAMILFSLVSGLFMYLTGRWAAQASEGIIRRLREKLYDHLQHLACRYFDKAETGDVVQRCTSDVETVRLFLASQVVEIGRAVLLLITVVPIMLMLDVPMTLVSLAGAPLIVAFSIVFFLRIRPRFQLMDESEGRMTAVLQENLTGIRVVRAFARQEHEVGKFAERVRAYRDHHYRLIQLLAIFWTISDFLVFVQQAAVLLAGAYWVSIGQLSVGTLVAFLLFVNIFIWPMRQLGRILADLGKALVALERIRAILAVPRESGPKSGPDSGTKSGPESGPKSSTGAADVGDPELLGGITFQNVSFRYDKDYALNDVSFVVQPGETLAILGPSGAGKSTIVDLLLRFYDGAAGRIELDGREICTLPRKWLRANIGVIMQEPFLYSKTVGQNIALGRPDAAHEDVIDAAMTAAMHDAIASFRDGYDTMVGERGVTLSGGQRQRVALARALIQRPAILILDDALSAVDTDTESLILESLRQRHGKQTTLVIAHRISTLRHADKVLVLDRGRVEQLGTHESLRGGGGVYQRIWEIQSATGDGGVSKH